MDEHKRIDLLFTSALSREIWTVHCDGEVTHLVKTHGMTVAEAMTRLRCRKAGVG
jgi:hypothetical protein